MTELDRLAAEREIRILKARYCRFVDTKQWDLFTALFTEDATLFFPESQTEPCGIADAMGFITGVLSAGVTSIHHVHAPEIELVAPDRARGIWAMEDRLYWPTEGATVLGLASMIGYGHYHEDYVRIDTGWKFQNLRLTRLRLEKYAPPVSVA